MTDRINTLTIVLEKDIRDDDCQPLISAIQMMRGVLSIKPNIANHSDFMAEERAKHELTKKIWEALKS